jgi:serine phosphatase RsbU (regulator of sigma subunit)
MLRFRDFFHIPQLDVVLAQLLESQPGLTVVAGMDPHPIAESIIGGQFLPSGRTAVFRMLVNEILAHVPAARAVIVTEEAPASRVPASLRRRVATLRVREGQSYARMIEEAARRAPDLLVIDRLTAETAPSATHAAREARVVSQLDTVFRGGAVLRHLHDLGVSEGDLARVRWIVWAQRLAMLCPMCRREVTPTLAQYERLERLIKASHCSAEIEGLFTSTAEQIFFTAPGCAACNGTGRQGDVAAFDIFRCPDNARDVAVAPSLLPLELYALGLAEQSAISLNDALNLDVDHLRRTYYLLSASERALGGANSALQRRLAELNAANQVLQQRTAALLSLQDIGQALISSTDLSDLVARVCRHTGELCGADRAILYLLRSDDVAEVCGVSGWDAALLNQRIDAALTQMTGDEPKLSRRWPPGIPPRHADVEGVDLRAGLWAPLIAERRQVGLMIVHTTHKSRFLPAEIALLKTFATQAAVALQRAELIERLRANIAELETAQAALVRQERMEREMELARQVQQSVLPRVFPSVAGYTFAAGNEPAREVGGDFYDVIALDDEHIGVVIADVSGKGMPAALYMALTRSLLLAEARRERSPCQALLNVNRLLRELGDPRMFVTVFYGVITLSTRRLTFARAGHDYPLLLRDDSATYLEGSGTVLGFFDSNELFLTEEHLILAPGDHLVLYTDGLTDALDATGDRFGMERLAALFQSYARCSAPDLCAATFADLRSYQAGAEQYDDMTLLVVAVGGEKTEN